MTWALVTVDCYGCRDAPYSPKELTKRALQTIREAQMHPYEHRAYAFKEGGEDDGASVLALILPLAESHLAVHTWPERRYVSIDLYTCGDDKAAFRAATALADSFHPEQQYIRVLDRSPVPPTLRRGGDRSERRGGAGDARPA
ncbi:MAG: S-adenosylmethionine decarboxylase [Bacillota bacterium]|nr:S-adenosylmethionine decarboxylase [Bacillota bacterium]